jgi:hypothetical protein
MNIRNAKRYAQLPRLEAHEVCRPRFAIRNPYVSGQGDFEIKPIYDYYGVAVATAVTAQTLFSVPQNQNHVLGGLNFVKTNWHTSMTQASQLPNPNRILVRRIAAYLLNRMNQVDVTRFLDETLLTFTIGDKRYLDVVLGKVPAGGGAWLQSVNNAAGIAGSGVPQSCEGYKLNGGPAIGPGGNPEPNRYPQVDGIEIAQGQTFGVLLDPTRCTAFNAIGVGFTSAAAGATPAGIGVHALIHLEGTQLLPVQ